MPTLTVDVTDLGPNNVGALGPAGLDEEQMSKVVNALAAPEYSLPASNRWICIDGRCSAKEMSRIDARHDADPQTAGSITITETAASYMDDPSTHQPQSVVTAELTRSAVADGLEVVLHGDKLNGKGGCKANALLREVLRFTDDNIDILAPRLWQACQRMGLDKWITEDDIFTSARNGNIAANDEKLWDCTAEEVVDIAVAGGAEYEEFEGEHAEVMDREDHTEGAFNKPRFNRDHAGGSRPLQVFSASVGKYRAEVFRRAKLHGWTEREAALRTMRAKLFNRAAKKMLMSDDAPIGIIGHS
ncbi:MAG TPA: hypothetical protein VFH99_04490 [Candidatus Saccharimonadales bacterium]|nr:hypothetical protein [Candidatus Saccharimonadales bacterium]